MKPGVESRRQADSSLRYLVKALLLRTPGRGVTGRGGWRCGCSWKITDRRGWKLVELCEPNGSREMSIQHPKLIGVFLAFPELLILIIKYYITITFTLFDDVVTKAADRSLGPNITTLPCHNCEIKFCLYIYI